MNFQTLIIIVVLGFLVFFGFAIYFIFKQIQFFIQATNLYKKMVTRQDMMIKLLTDIREGGLGIPNHMLASASPSKARKESIESFVTEEGTIAEQGFEEPRVLGIEDEAITQEELENLKRAAGKDATNFAYLIEKEWICVCGTHNRLERSAKVQNCSNCRRNRNYVLENFDQSTFAKPREPKQNLK